MRRVEATFIASRNSVVTRRIAGNDENISGRSIYRDVKRIMREIVILSAIQTSRIGVGNGKIRIAKIPTRATGMNSPRRPAFLNGIPAANAFVILCLPIELIYPEREVS
jgi:hypothetical protein